VVAVMFKGDVRFSDVYSCHYDRRPLRIGLQFLPGSQSISQLVCLPIYIKRGLELSLIISIIICEDPN